MAIVTRTLIDHIRIQFAVGEAHQTAKLGDVEGAHLVEVEFFIDDATGNVLGRTGNPKNGLPQPLDASKVSGLLGKKFTDFATQLADVVAQLGTAKQDVASRDATIAALQAQLAEANAAHADMVARAQAAAAALAAPVIQVAPAGAAS